MTIQLVVNGQQRAVHVLPDTPLLWVLRETLELTGTKYGCGRGLCGACSVHVEGALARSCLLPVSAVAGRRITTIEGLAADEGHPVVRAWIEEQVPQCGYCQPGQIVAATALLRQNPSPRDEEITRFMSGNVCRCGAYVRILRAVRRAARLSAAGGQ
jgi:aerobic-type carbon monoxide dehydrogenase small subunit (CoxS/CutS family)